MCCYVKTNTTQRPPLGKGVFDTASIRLSYTIHHRTQHCSNADEGDGGELFLQAVLAAEKVQDKIKSAVQSMLGLTVAKVNVTVRSVNFAEE